MKPMEFAVQMEEDGEKYYREQAARIADGGWRAVFNVLADEEKKHAELLRNHPASRYSLEDLAAKSVNVFKDLGDMTSEIHPLPDQFEIYHKALELEKKSIAQYREMEASAEDEPGRALLSFLIRQEEKHLALLDELMRQLRHAMEWPESAEFGLREEY